jgi:hypothetical protein
VVCDSLYARGGRECVRGGGRVCSLFGCVWFMGCAWWEVGCGGVSGGVGGGGVCWRGGGGGGVRGGGVVVEGGGWGRGRVWYVNHCSLVWLYVGLVWGVGGDRGVSHGVGGEEDIPGERCAK